MVALAGTPAEDDWDEARLSLEAATSDPPDRDDPAIGRHRSSRVRVDSGAVLAGVIARFFQRDFWLPMV